MNIVTRRQSCCSEVFRERLIDDSLSHLRSKKWYVVFFDKFCKIPAYLLTVSSCSYEYDWSFCSFEFRDEFFEHFFIDNWSSYFFSLCRYIFDSYIFCCYILRKFDSHHSWTFAHREFECIVYEGWYLVPTDNGCCILGDGSHHTNDIDDLEKSLFGFFYRLLSSDDNKWES